MTRDEADRTRRCIIAARRRIREAIGELRCTPDSILDGDIATNINDLTNTSERLRMLLSECEAALQR